MQQVHTLDIVSNVQGNGLNGPTILHGIIALIALVPEYSYEYLWCSYGVANKVQKT